MLGVNTGFKGIAVVAGLHYHYQLFKRAVACAFADTVDGAFDLPCSGLYRGQGIRNSQSEIVMRQGDGR